MYTNHPYLAQQLAREYTQDRLREANAHETVREARRRRTRESCDLQPTATRSGWRRWALWLGRLRTA